ncbi:MAG: CBS domain-containing protein [bacterium]|nr:CBS domain-containing protein [bacterium]
MSIDTKKSVAIEFMKSHPVDAARLLEAYPTGEIAALFAELPEDSVAAVLARMNPSLVFQYLESLSVEQAAGYLGRMPLGGVPGILRRYERERRQNILTHMKRETAQILRRSLRYPDGAAGTLANPKACTLPPDISVRRAIRRLRNHPDQVGANVYVVNVDNKLLGYVPLQRIFRARLKDPIASLMATDMNSIPGYSMPEDILQLSDWERFHELPVFDESQGFIGALRHAVVIASVAGRRKENDTGLETAVEAMDDLYRIGFSGLLKGVGASLLRGKTE